MNFFGAQLNVEIVVPNEVLGEAEYPREDERDQNERDGEHNQRVLLGICRPEEVLFKNVSESSFNIY
ncbi:MAG: hypothetical protein F4Y90_03985 [Rhodothermaceae bacterium]|nr:hypothetical protein [Rhodothermaceae bacterium]